MEIESACAISLFEYPLAINSVTCRSRAESGAKTADPADRSSRSTKMGKPRERIAVKSTENDLAPGRPASWVSAASGIPRLGRRSWITALRRARAVDGERACWTLCLFMQRLPNLGEKSDVSDEIIKRFFATMQSGATSEMAMMALFDENAVYIEPFGGVAQKHIGKPAIREAMMAAWRHPLPDTRIEIDSIRVEGDTVRASWTCYSPALPGGKGCGENIFTIRNHLILKLETRFVK